MAGVLTYLTFRNRYRTKLSSIYQNMRNAGDSAPLATLLAGKVSSADRGFQAITKLQTPGVVSFTFLIWYVLSSYLWLLNRVVFCLEPPVCSRGKEEYPILCPARGIEKSATILIATKPAPQHHQHNNDPF